MSEELERPDVPTPNGQDEPWAFCPQCGTPVAGKRFCPGCGLRVGGPIPSPAGEPAPRQPMTPAPVAPSGASPWAPYLDRPGVAFAAELVPGLLGFLGLGWFYARRWPVGLGLLLGWWGLLILVAASVLLLFGDVCCFLWLPFHVAVPLLSGFVVTGEVRQARRRRLMGL